MDRHRFDILLCALILLMISVPFVRIFHPLTYPRLSKTTLAACFALMLLSAVLAVSRTRPTAIAASSLAVLAMVFSVMNIVFDQVWVGVVYGFFEIAFLGYVVVLILARLFTEEKVTFNMICASLCVYLLLGVLWAVVFSLLETFQPGSFDLPVAEDGQIRRMLFGGDESIYPIYYSFVTITTLGYGDIVPTSPAAQMFSAVEALMGQLYLAVLVARLVGLHIAHAARKDLRGEDPPAEPP